MVLRAFLLLFAASLTLLDAAEGACAAPSPALATLLERTDRVLLASHGRLGWFNVSSGHFTVVHEGDGVYHGVAAGSFSEVGDTRKLSTVWAVQRPHNVGDDATPGVSTNTLMHLRVLDDGSGELIGKVPIDSWFSHEIAQLSGDEVLVCNTGRGQILRYKGSSGDSPSWSLKRTYDLFTRRDHINTIAVLDKSHILTMQHNSGRPSFIALIDLASGQIMERFEGLGKSCHGCSPWRDHIIYLESTVGALVKLPRDRKKPAKPVFEDDTKPRPRFAKGLLVVGDIAVFGLSMPLDRSRRNDPSNNADVVVFDLVEERVLLRAPAVQTQGLLNAIGAPQLFERAIESNEL